MLLLKRSQLGMKSCGGQTKPVHIRHRDVSGGRGWGHSAMYYYCHETIIHT